MKRFWKRSVVCRVARSDCPILYFVKIAGGGSERARDREGMGFQAIQTVTWLKLYLLMEIQRAGKTCWGAVQLRKRTIREAGQSAL